MTERKSMDVTVLPELMMCESCDETSKLIGWWGHPFFGLAMYQCTTCRVCKMYWIKYLQTGQGRGANMGKFYNDGSPFLEEEVKDSEGS